MSDNVFTLGNHFLIAMPLMDDPNFAQTVTYICEHSEYGALGVVINRPTTIMLSEVLEQMDIKTTNPRANTVPILYGGPVHQERGFVIHRSFGLWRSSFETAKGITVTTSRDILQAIATQGGPDEILVTLGYAGWGAGQLEEELTNNLWLSGPADPEIIFEVPFEERWLRAASLLGVDIRSISGDMGHA